MGKAPDEIKKSLKATAAKANPNNFSRTLSLNSEYNFNPSFRENNGSVFQAAHHLEKSKEKQSN